MMLDETPMRKGEAMSNDQGNPESTSTVLIPPQDQIIASIAPGPICPYVIGIKREIVVVKLRPVEICPRYRFFCRVFEALEKLQLQADMFSTSPGRITLALEPTALQAIGGSCSVTKDMMSRDLMQKLLPDDYIELFPHMAIISVVGHPSRRLAGHVFANMDAHDIPTVMISHGKLPIFSFLHNNCRSFLVTGMCRCFQARHNLCHCGAVHC
jgi:aspartokinase